MEPKSRIHFGSLEEKEKIRIETEEKRDGGVSEAVRAGMQAGNINITQGPYCHSMLVCVRGGSHLETDKLDVKD